MSRLSMTLAVAIVALLCGILAWALGTREDGRAVAPTHPSRAIGTTAIGHGSAPLPQEPSAARRRGALPKGSVARIVRHGQPAPLALRAAPQTDAPIIEAPLLDGSLVTIARVVELSMDTDQFRRVYQVRLANGARGWLPEDVLVAAP